MAGKERARRSYYPLTFNEVAFAATVRAIGRLSLDNRRYESISAVVSHVCRTCENIPQTAFDDLAALGGVRGDVKVFLKMDSEELVFFERFRALMAEKLGPDYRVAEAVILCCLILSPRNQGVVSEADFKHNM